MRVLGVVRLSRETEATTTPERQRESIAAWAVQSGHTVIGYAEDVGTSGAVSPFERIALGPWLAERHDEFDGLCAWKVDRLGRNVLHLLELVEWCEQHRKALHTSADPNDVTSPQGRAILMMAATFAQAEREAIRERSSGPPSFDRSLISLAAQLAVQRPPCGGR